jgi:succinate dehydrogenase / fumarate reductase cytochrome b subunit
MRHAADRRPAFFNLLQIQLPVGALTSIAHRVSGILLALGLPLVVYLLDLSLQGERGFARASAILGLWFIKIWAVVFIWSLAHHLLAGIRHMLSDIDVGSQLPAARRSAWIVNVCGIAMALMAAGALL